VNVWAASIVKGGPNPEAAKKYIDFLLSEYPQEINARLGFRNPVMRKSPPPGRRAGARFGQNRYL
jgi:iron(III) transport system substrate-binding protein